MTGAADASGELESLKRRGLLRTLRPRPAAGGKFTDPAGRTVLNFSSNDYLDLAGDARLKAAAVEAIGRWGCGATASRLMAGHLEIHERLERRLAAWTGREAALLFGSGFLTNLGVLTALAGRADAIFADRTVHASLIDAARLSGARLHRFRHNDTEHLSWLLERHASRRRAIVCESIYSMDGDAAPLAELSQIAGRHGAMLVVDEAHAVGVFGPRGSGLCRTDDAIRPDVVIGTLSKALGGYGGFAACSAAIRELLINRARSFIYSTGLPPACAGSALAALDVLDASPDLGDRLLERSAALRQMLADAGLDVGPSCSQIVPVIGGGSERVLSLSRRLAERGLLAVAVRPPTVPAGTARLRLSVTLAHQTADLERAANKVVAESGG